MDIIDIMLARAMTPQGKTEAYVAKAQRAANQAAQAETNAAAAIQLVENAADEIATAREEAASLLSEAQEVLETVQQAQINTIDTEDVDDEIKKLDISVNLVQDSGANTYQVTTTYPDNTSSTENATKMYKGIGANEDGTMTQKAITDALGAKADITYVNNAIASVPSGGGGSSSINLGSENAGKIVVVDSSGNITSGNLTEAAIVAGTEYVFTDTVGITLDCENKSFERLQDGVGKNGGQDFDQFSMFGGRMRCNVADDGTINAFYGDTNYKDDGSNGQVMVYQPKFYYQRLPLKVEQNTVGKTIIKEQLLISDINHPGFKLHPLFKDANGNTLEYVLLSAYQGSAYDVSANAYLLRDESGVDINNDKLSSVAGAKPISGERHSFTISDAEKMATNRGTGWHIMNMAANSVNQMLALSEFGMYNCQTAIESGVTDLNYNNTTANIAADTGSTAALGNTTGHASTTVVKLNNNTYNNDTEGKRAISYRGVENPWGNIWNYVGGMKVVGNGNQRGGTPYICTDFNYSGSNNYEDLGFTLPAASAWVYGMGYNNSDYDWIYLPSDTSATANSALPIGDFIWVVSNLNGVKVMVSGGMWNTAMKSGLFCYGCDCNNTDSFKSYSARLMYIPTINSIYNTNHQAWLAKMGV